MSDLLRDAPVGQIFRLLLAKGRFYRYQYLEERADFQIPPGYTTSTAAEKEPELSHTPEPGLEAIETETETGSPTARWSPSPAVDLPPWRNGLSTTPDHEFFDGASDYTARRERSHSNLEAGDTDAVQLEPIIRQPSRPIVPQTTRDGVVLVDWYTIDDPENPKNWTMRKKLFVVFEIYVYTLAVYIGSAMVTPSEPYIQQRFGVSPELSSMSLSLYVAGYGIGPLIFSPMSEIPIIGRNPPYMATMGIFLIISIVTAVVDSFPALMVLRFFQGFFGSPILATGGASISDIFPVQQLPYYITAWGAFATAGPALGPLISGFSVPHENWHWSLWEIVWFNAPVYVWLLFCLPETSAPTILLRRAHRLRKLTGKANLRSQSEIDQDHISVREIVVSNLWRPLQINALDPAVLFTSLYTGLMYMIFYSFFEVFPFVYGSGLPRPHSPTHGYHFNPGQIGLTFLAVAVGVCIAMPAYLCYLKFVFDPAARSANGPGPPERRLVPALIATFCLPVGLFLFAWTGFNSPKIHWAYAASLFAGNDFARSSMAAGAIHYSRPMFLNLGVGPAVSLLAGLTFAGVIGIYALYFFGANLRARSRFAV
ncbi:hypothetical protein DV735_g2302, partial [Chaetothyriales sp. CBS 134920]